MGPAVPHAIGAKFVFPDRPVVALAGAMQMNGMAELLTVARYRECWSDQRLVVCVLHNDDLNQVTWELPAMGGAIRAGGTSSCSAVPPTTSSDSCGHSRNATTNASRPCTESSANAGPHDSGGFKPFPPHRNRTFMNHNKDVEQHDQVGACDSSGNWPDQVLRPPEDDHRVTPERGPTPKPSAPS
jgi:hypothetical protein